VTVPTDDTTAMIVAHDVPQDVAAITVVVDITLIHHTDMSGSRRGRAW
jgi:hypothetical protein